MALEKWSIWFITYHQKTGKKPLKPSQMDEWTNKLWYIHNTNSVSNC